MKYQFYIKMDDKAYGPYSLDEYVALNVPEDTEVMEASIGEWLPASDYPSYEELKIRENGYIIHKDGSIGKVKEEEGYEDYEEVIPFSSDDNQSFSTESELPKTGWNWGAFFFSWLWGIFNGVYWPLIMFACVFIPYVGPFITLAICVALGIYGNQWAWEAKSWDSAEHFNRVQRNWAKAVLYYLLGCFVLGFLTGLISGLMSNN